MAEESLKPLTAVVSGPSLKAADATKLLSLELPAERIVSLADWIDDEDDVHSREVEAEYLRLTRDRPPDAGSSFGRGRGIRSGRGAVHLRGHYRGRGYRGRDYRDTGGYQRGGLRVRGAVRGGHSFRGRHGRGHYTGGHQYIKERSPCVVATSPLPTGAPMYCKQSTHGMHSAMTGRTQYPSAMSSGATIPIPSVPMVSATSGSAVDFAHAFGVAAANPQLGYFPGALPPTHMQTAPRMPMPGMFPPRLRMDGGPAIGQQFAAVTATSSGTYVNTTPAVHMPMRAVRPFVCSEPRSSRLLESGSGRGQRGGRHQRSLCHAELAQLLYGSTVPVATTRMSDASLLSGVGIAMGSGMPLPMAPTTTTPMPGTTPSPLIAPTFGSAPISELSYTPPLEVSDNLMSADYFGPGIDPMATVRTTDGIGDPFLEQLIADRSLGLSVKVESDGKDQAESEEMPVLRAVKCFVPRTPDYSDGDENSSEGGEGGDDCETKFRQSEESAMKKMS